MLLRAAAGAPPPADGAVEVLPPLPGPVDAVLGFTAHSVVVAGVDPAAVRRRLPAGDLGAPLEAPFLTWLADHLGGEPGSVDVVLAAPGLPGPTVPAAAGLALRSRPDLAGHARVARAARFRREIRVLADDHERAVVLVGRGLAGRWELAFEVEPGSRNRGLGRALAVAARGLVPAGEPLFAQAAPGNAAALRAVLAAGFQPVGSEVLFLRPVGA